jgi:ABC-type dipeptide/oligopeptide/nickel transport system permease subunit
MIGAIVGGLSGYIVENNDEQVLKLFAFLWTAPILLFIPIYVSYYKSENYIRNFLCHALLGSSLSVLLVILTLYLLKTNIIFALMVNFILSIGFVHLYFKYIT